jgi:hypothetical protein
LCLRVEVLEDLSELGAIAVLLIRGESSFDSFVGDGVAVC